MDDFSTPNVTNNYGIPPSEHNFIVPGKRPTSSMAPSIIVDNNNKVKLVLGASGGPRIISAVAYVSFKIAVLACREQPLNLSLFFEVILSYQVVSDYWVIHRIKLWYYFIFSTIFDSFFLVCKKLFLFLVLSRWFWNTFIWKKMWKVPLIVQGPTINWFQWKLTTKLEYWRWTQSFLISNIYRVSHCKVGKVNWLWWGCKFHFLLV